MSISTLFLPDISGFTRFVKNTEILHGQHIIKELINIIIKVGSDKMDVVEIEGDAVFFFKEGEQFSIEEIEDLSRKIYQEFHRHLQIYENKRICNCGACTTAIDLKLKFIVHSGEVSLVKYSRDKSKPFGSAVIAAHRLMKNDIPDDEYLLVSEDFLAGKPLQNSSGGSVTDKDLGEIPFQYWTLSDWKPEVLPVEEEVIPVDFEAEEAITIPYPQAVIHQFISDFRYRKLWNNEAEEIIYDENSLNEEGTEHYCVVNGKTLYFDTVKPIIEGEGLSYGEILRNPKPLKYFETNFLIIPVDKESAHLILKLRASVRWRVQILFLPLFKRMMKQRAKDVLRKISASLSENLKTVQEDID